MPTTFYRHKLSGLCNSVALLICGGRKSIVLNVGRLSLVLSFSILVLCRSNESIRQFRQSPCWINICSKTNPPKMCFWNSSFSPDPAPNLILSSSCGCWAESSAFATASTHIFLINSLSAGWKGMEGEGISSWVLIGSHFDNCQGLEDS